MDTDSPPANRNRLAWIMAVAIVLLILVGAGAFFGSGQKIWSKPGGVRSYWGADGIRCFCVATQEEADALVGATCRLVRDDVQFEMEIAGTENAVAAWGEHGIVVTGKMSLEIAPYIGWPGNVCRLETGQSEVEELVDEALKKRVPDLQYEWVHSCKIMLNQSFGDLY